MSRVSLFAPPTGMPKGMLRARRHMLARTGLAWLGMMQIMMLAFPGYLRSGVRTATAQASLEDAIVLMNWISLVLCVPLVMYCAWPIWKGAWRDLVRLRIGMDVPVALGVLAAFLPSVHATWAGVGEVYFDSVSMFIAFLLTARYLEACARQAVPEADSLDGVPLLRHADRLAFWFVLIQILLAACVGLYWARHAPNHALAVTVALLVMSCPCALSMSVPAALSARRAVQLHADGGLSAVDLAILDGATARVARQSLYGSLAWHLLMTPLAALGWVQPWLAAITMLVSSLAVAGNAWRLTRKVRPGVSALAVDSLPA